MVISFDIVFSELVGIDIDSPLLTSIFVASSELNPQLKLRESPKIKVGVDGVEFERENSIMILEIESHMKGVWN